MEARQAFDRAIETGRLNTDKDSFRFAGSYMYMGCQGGIDQFKSINYRSYLDGHNHDQLVQDWKDDPYNK
jgi:hypothetical protein